MTPLPPPPKVNPSAAALAAAAQEALEKQKHFGEVKVNPDTGVPLRPRDIPAPPGYRKVYTQAPPHQGSREMARRARQLRRKFHES